MFKNRAIQVKMVKNANEELKDSERSEVFEGKVAIVGYYLKNTVTSVGKLVLAYVVADTIRQIAVNKTS